MQRTSYRRRTLENMIEMFNELNQIPHEKRKNYGKFGQWKDYDFMIAECQKQIEKLDKQLEAVQKVKKK